MAVRTVEELLASVKEALGDAVTSDTGISLLEDITDSMKTDGEDWKTKYEENDASWRKRYADRFSGKHIEPKPEPEPEPEPEPSPKTLEDVFEWKED